MGFRAALGLDIQLLSKAVRGGRLLRASLILAAAVASAGCPASGGAPRPNVLLVSIDSLRSDVADGALADTRTGPALRKLISEGAVFPNASAAAPWTTPSMMTVLTGLDPWSHHVRDHNWALPSGIPLLSERLKSAGYDTAAVVPSATLREEFGFSRGFDFWSNGHYGHDVVTSPAMTGQALQWLSLRRAARDARPWFLWIHFWDPHYNYLPPSPYDQSFPSQWRPAPGTRFDMTELKNHEAPLRPQETAFLRTQYEGEILYTDRYLADLLDFVEQAWGGEKTLIVLVGDHGEAFQEHGWLTHTIRVHEEMIHVPLVLRWPGHLPGGARHEEPVSLASVTPTILEALGLESPAGAFDGAGLWHGARGGGAPSAAGALPIVSETIRGASLSALRDGSWKYILDMNACTGTLFDLAADPGEAHDLAAAEPERAAAMRSALLAFYRDNPRAAATKPEPMPEESDEDLELLRSLGYIGATTRDRFGDAVTFAGRTDPGNCR